MEKESLGARAFQILERLGDIMLCSLYFTVCCIPVVTVGASAAGMHYALRRCYDDSGSVTRDFFSAFRRNFLQATAIWLILAAAGGVLLVNFWLAQEWDSGVVKLVKAAIAVMSVLVLADAAMVFPMLARFDNSIWALMKNSLLLALLHPLRTVVLIALMVLPVALSLILPEMFGLIVALWTLGLCGASGYMAQMLIIPVFRKLEEPEGHQEER